MKFHPDSLKIKSGKISLARQESPIPHSISSKYRNKRWINFNIPIFLSFFFFFFVHSRRLCSRSSWTVCEHVTEAFFQTSSLLCESVKSIYIHRWLTEQWRGRTVETIQWHYATRWIPEKYTRGGKRPD